ncbi:ADP-ribosylation factor-like protein 13B [Caenorhabditis elegans]|uniref:Isoform b of ADP-ribosylation factor-like protein 13B n=2 Tax=Caenorhabditis elegans TaxID=6239 RepID=H2L0N8-2|nr:ADP-ribosylation factor-like protein 13B [Caenorhabditis elegans]CCD73426.1 ADP-ribosylation factor-like protein 13B [Caenorhabditis elegans]|eukprot:NP_001032987.1 ADP-ribosylation factor-like protein 13B [Caenorhabditis elegans]
MTEKSWFETIFCCCCHRTPIIRREIKLGCFGIGSAGKTTFLKVLKGEDPRDLLRTNGFSTVKMEYDETFHLTIYDVGGDKGIRGIWSNYYAEVHGIIYVIDYSTDETFTESIEALHSLTSNPHVQKKPIFLLLNNQNNREFDDVEISNETKIQAGQHKIVLFSHFNKYNGYLDNIKSATLTVMARAKKDRNEYQEQFVRFIDSISEHYVELSEGVKTAELALRIRQEEAKEQRRLMQMKVEHDALKADVAGLELRNQPPVQPPIPPDPPSDPKSASVHIEESPPMSLASSTIPSDIIQSTPETGTPRDPVKISQTSTKPVSPESNSVKEEPTIILKDNYFLPPKAPGRQYSRIQRIQNVLNNRVVPK